jgi:hypothetical protein
MNSSQDAGSTTSSSIYCVQCSTSFTRRSDLARHTKEVKAHQDAIKCPVPGCWITFQRPLILERHFWKEHRHQLGRDNQPLSSMVLILQTVAAYERETNRGTGSMDFAHGSEQGTNYGPLDTLLPYPSGSLCTEPQELTLPGNSSLPLKNATFASYGKSHYPMQPRYQAHDHQGRRPMSASTFQPSSTLSTSVYTNDWQMFPSMSSSLPSSTSRHPENSDNSSNEIVFSATPGFPAPTDYFSPPSPSTLTLPATYPNNWRMVPAATASTASLPTFLLPTVPEGSDLFDPLTPATISQFAAWTDHTSPYLQAPPINRADAQILGPDSGRHIWSQGNAAIERNTQSGHSKSTTADGLSMDVEMTGDESVSQRLMA